MKSTKFVPAAAVDAQKGERVGRRVQWHFERLWDGTKEKRAGGKTCIMIGNAESLPFAISGSSQ
jgi:hypothetical protein